MKVTVKVRNAAGKLCVQHGSGLVVQGGIVWLDVPTDSGENRDGVYVGRFSSSAKSGDPLEGDDLYHIKFDVESVTFDRNAKTPTEPLPNSGLRFG